MDRANQVADRSSNASRRGRTLLIGMLLVSIGSTTTAFSGMSYHYGLVLPLASHGNGQSSTVADRPTIGVPLGVGLGHIRGANLDFEIVPVVQTDPGNFDLTVHPGLIFSATNRLAVGVRAAYEIDSRSWGLTPLVHSKISQRESRGLFWEIVAPIRVQEDSTGRSFASIGIGIHFGDSR